MPSDADLSARQDDAGRGARWLRWLPILLAVALLAYFVAPMWREPHTWAGWWDVRYFWFVVEVDYTTIVQHHQLPLWNPYYCGGAPQLANAQAATLSPLTPLVALLGMPIGYRAGYTAGLLAAIFTMRSYARALGLSELASTIAGAGFGMCGVFAMHLGGGLWSWLGFVMFPLVLSSLHQAAEGRRAHYVWGAVSFAIIVFHAPVYPLAYAFLMIGVYAVLVGLANGPRDRARLGRALLAAFTTIVLGLLLSAVRAFPLWDHVSHHPRPVKDWDHTWPWELFVTYGWRWPERGFGDHQYVFPEFGNYFGIVGLLLVAGGIFVIARRRRALWPLVAAAFVFVLFQLGNLVPMPWWLVKHLPVYEHLRVPSRFTIIVGIFFCAFIGLCVDEWGTPALARWRELSARRRVVAVGVIAAAAVYLVDIASWNRIQFIPTFGSPPPRDAHAAEFHQVPGDRGRMMAYPPANLGTLSCYEETPVPISPRLRGDLPADEYLADPGAGTVKRELWSPNRIVLDVDARRPTTVLVNQNMGVGWRAEGAELVPEGEGGLLAARVAAGRHRVTFRYLPRSFVVGGVVSLVSLAGAVVFLASERRRRRRFGAAGVPR